MPGKPAHHTAGGFRNPPGSPEAKGGFGDWGGFFYRGATRSADVTIPADHVVPSAKVKARLHQSIQANSLTWLGHASFLLRLDGRWIVTDPFLSDHASPVPPLGPKRFAPPAVRAEDLPPIDLILLSHNHYDHMDLPSLAALPRAPGATVVMPLGVGSYLPDQGETALTELDWMDQAEVGGIKITALPAIHFSKRGLFDGNDTLWAGYGIEGASTRLYFAGDTAYGPVFPQIGADLGGFDLGMVPIGAYAPRPLMQGSHTTPEEAVRIGKDLNISRIVGMHWGTIMLTDEPPFEPPKRFLKAASLGGYGEDEAFVMRIGETRAL